MEASAEQGNHLKISEDAEMVLRRTSLLGGQAQI